MSIWDILTAHPWLPALMAAALGVWITAIIVIVRSPNFLRKGLWVLLTLLQVKFSWGVDGWTFGVGVPIGALYVLWFWKFGAAPTPEQIAANEARRQPVTGPPWRIWMLRIAYVMAFGGAGLMGFLIASGAVMNQMVALAGEDAVARADVEGFRTVLTYGGSAVLVAFGALIAFLAFRPFWWGKLLCLFAGLAWLMNGLVMAAFGLEGTTSSLILTCGAAMLGAALLHQIADPRFSGGWMRS